MRGALVVLLVLRGLAFADSSGSGSGSSGDDGQLRPEDLRDVFDGKPPPPPSSEADETTPAPSSDDESPTGTGRVGVYADTDHTTVYRALATLAKRWGEWSVSGGVTVDAVTSASVDVRSSPELSAVDVITTASGRSSSSGGQMTDTRYLGTLTGGWNDGSGRTASTTASVAKEADYASVSGGINGSIDVLDRTLTLLGGFTITDNWVSSVLDPTLNRKMFATGWSAGIARVLTPEDAIRLRYDGKLADGDQASPYRTVRFGDWTTTTNATGGYVFANTIGSAGGLAEKLPQVRVGYAAVLEWVHSLAPGIGMHPQVRLGHDSWGIDSVTASLDLRIARPGWRAQLGYRFYKQTAADFYESKYMNDPSTYSYYTSDKELGRETGHLVGGEIAAQVSDPDGPNDSRMLLYLHTDVFRYAYPGFVLLPSRTSAFVELGLSWER
jgi:hypothetical protein